MFSQEGNVQLIIGEIAFSECKFADGKGPDDFDICIEVTHAEDPTQHDWARLEWSENYGKGVVSHLMQRDLALQTLHKIGFEGDDLSTLEEQLPAGTIVPGRVTSKEKDGVTYYHVFLGAGGGGNAPSEDKRLSMAELKRRLMKSGGGKSAGGDGDGDTKPAPNAAAASGKNPFA